jgi:hypothetical protein
MVCDVTIFNVPRPFQAGPNFQWRQRPLGESSVFAEVAQSVYEKQAVGRQTLVVLDGQRPQSRSSLIPFLNFPSASAETLTRTTMSSPSRRSSHSNWHWTSG